MTGRELFRQVLRREIPERIPFVARLDLWHRAAVADGSLPEEIEGLSIPEIENRLEMGRSARFNRFFEVDFDGVETIENRDGLRVITEYRLAKRSLKQVYALSEDSAKGVRGHVVEYPLKNADDYELMTQFWRRARWRFHHDEFRKFDEETGADGLPMIIAGPSPAHLVMLSYAGYDNFYLHQSDFPDSVASLIRTMEESHDNLHCELARSGAEIVLHGAHWSADMTPPPIFRRLFLPYFQRFTDLMHKAGKQCVFHADAELFGMLDEVVRTGVDVADCFACEPLVRLGLGEARRAWGDKIVIWGGIPSTILLPSCPRLEFEDYLDRLCLGVADGRAFIAGISDNLMPGSQWDRIVELSRRVADIRPGRNM